MYSKLYLSGIEINIEASEAVYKTASKLYLSGIEMGAKGADGKQGDLQIVP